MKRATRIAGGVLLALVITAGFMLGGSVLDGGIVNAKSIEASPTQRTPGGIIKLASATANAGNNDTQFVTADVEPFAYPDITVEVNKPVRINFYVTEANLNLCNDKILIPEWNITKKLTIGDNFVEFTPTKTGTFTYTCWMDMIRGTITVVSAQANLPAESAKGIQAQALAAMSNNTSGSPDAGTVSVDGNITVIEAKVAPGGYPSIVMEVNKTVCINFKVDAADLNACNNEIVIPEWNIRKTLTAGDNYIELTPTKTGTFGYSCWMGMLRSSFTVIEQGSGDIGALPLGPSAYTAAGCGMMGNYNGMSGGCCGRR